jgi:hypothetical protein
MPRRTEPPVAVLPFKQYAVAVKLPRLEDFEALTIAVVLINLSLSDSCCVFVFVLTGSWIGSSAFCESVAILRVFTGRLCAMTNTIQRPNITGITPPLTSFLIIPTLLSIGFFDLKTCNGPRIPALPTPIQNAFWILII